MRGLIVLALMATARAEATGYNYGAGISGSGSAGSSLGGGSSGGSLSGSYTQDYAPINTEFNKEFFTYSAPEADFEDNTHSVRDLAASLKKNLRVVFIRAPENKGLENAALSLAKQAAEQQTAIYVLTKQGDLSSLANQLQNLNHVSASKPEVHFVKYRTPEDALNAQRTIQQEYERLGGSSALHNGGIAPVLDFTSKPLQQQQHRQQQLQQPAALVDERSVTNVASELEAPSGYIPPAAAAPSANYLPVSKVK